MLFYARLILARLLSFLFCIHWLIITGAQDTVGVGVRKGSKASTYISECAPFLEVVLRSCFAIYSCLMSHHFLESGGSDYHKRPDFSSGWLFGTISSLLWYAMGFHHLALRWFHDLCRDRIEWDDFESWSMHMVYLQIKLFLGSAHSGSSLIIIFDQ